MTTATADIERRASPGTLVHIVYENGSGLTSRRRVRVERWLHGRNGFSYLRGFCSLRGEDRTFRSDRILEWSVEGAVSSRAPAAEAASQPRVAAVPVSPSMFSSTATAPSLTRQPHHGSRSFLGLFAAVAAFFILRAIVSGGSQPSPTPVPRYVPPPSPAKMVVVLAPKPILKPAPKPAERTDPATAHLRAFRGATGISAPALEAIYEQADTRRDGRLDWEELSAFQSWLKRTYAYLSNDLALRPDEFLAEGGGDCEDWSLFTCGLLRYWGWDPYVGSLAPSESAVGHAVCLVRLEDRPVRFTWWSVEDDETLGGFPVKPGWYVPIDYDTVGGLSNAVDEGWKLRAIWVPESIYEKRM